MRRLLLGLVAVSLTMSLQSCFMARSGINEPLMAAAVKKLQPGKSTAKDVVDLLGAPTEVIQLGKRSAYRYDHTNTKRAGLTLLVVSFFNEDSREDRVWLFFDENEQLTHMGSTFSSHRPQYAMPWEDVHEEDENRSADADRKDLNGAK